MMVFSKKCSSACVIREFKLKEAIILWLLFYIKIDTILTLLNYYSKVKGYIEHVIMQNKKSTCR